MIEQFFWEGIPSTKLKTSLGGQVPADLLFMDKTRHQLPAEICFFLKKITRKKTQKTQTHYFSSQTPNKINHMSSNIEYLRSSWKTQRYRSTWRTSRFCFPPRRLPRLPPFSRAKCMPVTGKATSGRQMVMTKMLGTGNLRIRNVLGSQNLFPILSSSSWHLKWFWKELPGERVHLVLCGPDTFSNFTETL